MPRPHFIIDTATLPEDDTGYPDSDERLSFGRVIGKAAGLTRLGLHLERVPPGRRTSFPHAHGDEEEFVYVLEGEVDLWIDGALHRMRAGDLAGFPAGTGACHSVLNNGTADALLLVGGEASTGAGRLFYPHNPERRAQLPAARWWGDVPRATQGDHDGRAGNRLGAAALAWATQLCAEGVAIDPVRASSWMFGDAPEMARELADLVVAGPKRATAGLLWTYQRERLPLPAPGDPSIVTLADGTPICLIETTQCDVIPFAEVGADFAATEGEGDGSLAYWRREHWAYFARECAAMGREPADDMPIVCERFRLVRVHG